MKLAILLVAALFIGPIARSQDAGASDSRSREIRNWGTVRDPMELGQFVEKGNSLTATVTGGGADFSQFDRTAPSVVREVDGDFIATLTVEPGMQPAGVAMTSNKVVWNSAGLLIEVDKDNFIRLELSIRKHGEKFDNRLWAHRVVKGDAKWDQPVLKAWDPTKPVHFRIQRTGAKFKWAYSYDKLAWTELAPFEAAKWPQKLNAGVAFVNLTSAPSRATVSDLVIKKPE
jgi:regulation of enolase protein 1 (concanavalin A-like superfamily)